jgi:hypothetical protein
MDYSRMEFTLGVDSEKPVQRSGVEIGGVFPDYNPRRLGVHDIAYAYLKKRMTEAEAVPLDLPRKALSDSTHLLFMHVGYGISGPKVGARRCVNIPVKDLCDSTFSHETQDLNTCHGDSGGGIFHDFGDRVQLVGLTGWGDDGCEKFGVNADVGRYYEWIAFKKVHAPKNVPLARVEPSARKSSRVRPEKFLSDISATPGEQVFAIKYKGWFVTWDATVVSVRQNAEISDACDLRVTTGPKQNMNMWLHEYPGGCQLEEGNDVHFTGRLVNLRYGGLDIAHVEPVAQTTAAQPPPPLPPVGTYTLAKLTPRVREIRETQTQDLRLESRHGSWSGRVQDCRQVSVTGPGRLDRDAPIVFKPAYVNHAGYGPPQNLTDQGFCVPLWAEGFGGAQVLGATVDAGQVGVVSGTVVYGIVRTESTTDTEVVRTGTVPGEADGVTVDLPNDGQYLVTVKLPDGGQETIKGSGTYGAIEATRSDKAIHLRPRSSK